jgi:hypothetical protein
MIAPLTLHHWPTPFSMMLFSIDVSHPECGFGWPMPQ